MQSFDISWVAIFKIMGAGAFSYIVLPALLVLRDLLLNKVVEKWVLTDNLNTLIHVCENDRWFLNNKYNKSIELAYGANGATYKIDGNVVSYEKFSEFEINKNFHSKRYEFANSKINMRHNLMVWIEKHYKQAGGGNPIPNLRKQYYETAGVREEKK